MEERGSEEDEIKLKVLKDDIRAWFQAAEGRLESSRERNMHHRHEPNRNFDGGFLNPNEFRTISSDFLLDEVCQSSRAVNDGSKDRNETDGKVLLNSWAKSIGDERGLVLLVHRSIGRRFVFRDRCTLPLPMQEKRERKNDY